MNVVLGVSGGIAAYKSPEVVRRLKDAGHRVRVVMTRGAEAFVTPLTFQAVSGEPVHRDLLDESAEAAMGHIELARWADAVLVAPATANLMARLAHGFADDLLTTLCLATAAPVAVAPAMNQQMWRAPATQANLDVLRARGVRIVGPDAGWQACGDTGPGRMSEPHDIVAALAGGVAGAPFADGGGGSGNGNGNGADGTGSSGTGSGGNDGSGSGKAGAAALAGLRVLVTAGPTREPIDPVRFISNRSSGKMGFAVAAAALDSGAEVEVVCGPVSAPPPPGARVVPVGSAGEMHREVMARAAGCHIFIAAAAVADYAPAAAAPAKLKKESAPSLRLELEPTRDIVAEVAALAAPPFTVGFAAETGDLERHAGAKLDRKRLDMIAGNRVDVPGSGFDGDCNSLLVLWPDGGRAELEPMPKTLLARRLLALVAERFHAKRADPHA